MEFNSGFKGLRVKDIEGRVYGQTHAIGYSMNSPEL